MNPATARAPRSRRTRVLIVDDSITICRLLCEVFADDPQLEVLGFALDAYKAREKIKQLNPDVLTLDIEMPRMDGVTFLKNLMRLHPMPVVMFSSLTQAGATATLDALQAGAVDFMPKHSARSGQDQQAYFNELIQKIKMAVQAQIPAQPALRPVNPVLVPPGCSQKIRRGERASDTIKRLIAVGVSTGGPEALREHVVGALSDLSCALVICQHMPAYFMSTFAKGLNQHSAFSIDLAKAGERLEAGCGYLAPGDQHLMLEKRADGLYWALSAGEEVDGHRPSVSVLFDSLAAQVPRSTVAVLMTGMGEDGARSLRTLRDKGALTLIQDQASSVVWGMPGKAHALEAHDQVLPADQLAPTINTLLGQVR